MLPGRAVAGRLAQEPRWAGIPLGALYQHEFRTVDGNFPYPGLTLAQLGIPAQDVLQVAADAGDYYVEMD